MITLDIEFWQDEKQDWLIRQLKELQDPENMEDEDIPLTVESFNTFINFMIELKPLWCPSLGVTYDGNLTVGFGDQECSYIVCYKDNKIHWSQYWYDSFGIKNSKRADASLPLPYDLRSMCPVNFYDFRFKHFVKKVD